MENIYSRTARFFVENRQLSLLLVLASFAFGALAFALTPKQYNPEITLPAFRITTSFPGATAQEVEQRVTDPIENKLAEIPGVDTIQSQSVSGGASIVTVIFKIGTSLDASKTEITQKLQSNIDLAPLGAQAPLIKQIDPENVPVMTIAVTSPTVSENGLRLFALDLAEKLKTVPGVTALEVSGGHVRQLSVQLDPDRMAARRVSVSEAEQAIRANDIYVSGPAIEARDATVPISLDGTLTNGEDLAHIVVGGSVTAPVYLSDISTVTDGYDTLTHRISYLTRAATTSPHVVYLSYAKTKGANITAVTQAVDARLAELKTYFVPDTIALTVVRDEGATAGEEVSMLTEHLLFAIGIVTLTLVFFLGWRAALVVATAIPLTLALVFIIGYFTGQTINRITLFALIFSLGLLVDDAIVVIENIYRRFSHKTESKTEAIAHATGEVGMGVLLSTITAVVVFVPMGLVTGMMGAYMGPIAFFAPVARLASLFVAYTLSPFAASVFLKESTGNEHGDGTTWYETRYKTFIHRVLKDRPLQDKIIGATLLVVVAAFALPVVELVHFRMLPKADKEQFYVYLDMPARASFAQTDAAATRIEKLMLADASVDALETVVGTPPVVDFNGLFRGSDARSLLSQATIKVDLRPKGTRPKSEDVVAALRPILTPQAIGEPDARLKLVEDPPGPPVLSTLLVRIKGPDPAVRDAIARDMLARFHATAGVVDIDSSLPTGGTETTLVVDHEKLSRSGLSVADVADTIEALGGSSVATAHVASREDASVFVRFAKDARDQLGDLSRIQLKSRSGALVPLLSVARLAPTNAAAPIMHDEREAMAVVGGEVSGRSVVYVVKDLIFSLMHYSLPGGTGKLVSWNLYGLTYEDRLTHDTYRLEWGGEFEMTLDNFRDLGLAMLVSYFLIYVILVAQFKSFRSPALIMTTIILGFAGVLPGFALLDLVAGTYFSATSMIGVIALGGIVVGNAILLLDFIEQLRERGQTITHAIVEACRTRLRPIMLTSITAILGSVVIVTDPVWSGLAWAIIFGLSLSTVLTLVIFPVLYFRFGSGKAE